MVIEEVDKVTIPIEIAFTMAVSSMTIFEELLINRP
jgi:hypothetical protein